jgi:hypothetical protein
MIILRNRGHHAYGCPYTPTFPGLNNFPGAGKVVMDPVRGAEVVDRLVPGHDQLGVLHAGVRVHGQDVRQELVAEGDVVEAVRVERLLDQPLDGEERRAAGPRPAGDLVRAVDDRLVLVADVPGQVATLWRPSGCR